MRATARLCCSPAAFALVYLHLLGGWQAFYAMLGLGLVQMAMHFRYSLHIGLTRSAQADLQLILFSALIIALMVGGMDSRCLLQGVSGSP